MSHPALRRVLMNIQRITGVVSVHRFVIRARHTCRPLPVRGIVLSSCRHGASHHAMIRTQQIRLRGTRYYEAPALYRSGELRAGRKVLLEHQPYNPHDRFAVAVMLADTHAMLGHIPREWAPMYAQRLQRKEIRDAYLVGASPRHDTVDVRIGVTYSISEEIPTEQPPCVVNQPLLTPHLSTGWNQPNPRTPPYHLDASSRWLCSSCC